MLARALLLVGATATLLAAFLPWVTVKGLRISLDLGLIGADLGAGNRTVAGTDTPLWPVLVGIALVVAVLALLGIAMRVALGIGLLVTVAGGALLYYMANVLDIATRGDGGLKRALAQTLLSSSVGPGPPLLLAGGVAIVAGALLHA